MSIEQKPLTAEEIAYEHSEEMALDTGGIMILLTISDAVKVAERYAAQQTAEKEAEIAKLREELESANKERDEKVKRYCDVIEVMARFQSQRDEAVKLLRSLPSAWKNDNVNSFLSHLS